MAVEHDALMAETGWLLGNRTVDWRHQSIKVSFNNDEGTREKIRMGAIVQVSR